MFNLPKKLRKHTKGVACSLHLIFFTWQHIGIGLDFRSPVLNFRCTCQPVALAFNFYGALSEILSQFRETNDRTKEKSGKLKKKICPVFYQKNGEGNFKSLEKGIWFYQILAQKNFIDELTKLCEYVDFPSAETHLRIHMIHDGLAYKFPRGRLEGRPFLDLKWKTGGVIKWGEFGNSWRLFFTWVHWLGPFGKTLHHSWPIVLKKSCTVH